MPRKGGSGDSKGWLLGLGLDSDGQKRATRGENFLLWGGTRETHACMQEKAIKINEILGRRGKRLEDLSHQEFCEIARKLSLQVVPSHRQTAPAGAADPS